MRISRQADYAMRVVMDLTITPEGHIKNIAMRQGLSSAYVGRISQILARAGLLSNRRGRLGHLKLAVPPEDITLLRVIEAVDGPVPIDRCFLAPDECGRSLGCPTYRIGQDVLQYAVTKLGSTTFAELANGNGQH